MSNKFVVYTVVTLAGLVIAGSAVFVVMDIRKSQDQMTESAGIVNRHEKALAEAKAAAREKIREGMREGERELSEREGKDAVRVKNEAAKKRREAVRRKFFGGGGGFTLSAEYAKACEMPKGDPSAEDQEIIDLAAESYSEVDLDTAAEVTEAALKSKDPRARIAAVEMLSILGEAGLSDISEFLTDEHPEVANLAADRWELGVQDIMDEGQRTALVKVGLLAITDEDQLRSMVGTLLLTSDELLVIQTVADVMRDGKKVQRDAVKDAYENITGEEWKGEEAAEAWLQENYTPPEPEEESDSESDTESAEEEESESGVDENAEI